jgi:hypothetical protein
MVVLHPGSAARGEKLDRENGAFAKKVQIGDGPKRFKPFVGAAL